MLLPDLWWCFFFFFLSWWSGKTYTRGRMWDLQGLLKHSICPAGKWFIKPPAAGGYRATLFLPVAGNNRGTQNTMGAHLLVWICEGMFYHFCCFSPRSLVIGWWLWPKGRWAEAALTRSSLGQEKALRKGPFCHPKQIVHFVNANHIGVLQDLLTWPW